MHCLFFSVSIGYTLESSLQSCYKYHMYDGNTWSGAKSTCTQEGGWLVTIDSPEENAFLLHKLQSYGYSNIWIGLSEASQSLTWTWTHARSSTNQYMNWAPGNPPSYNNGNNCGLFYVSSSYPGYWSAYYCQTGVQFVCEFNDVAYELYKQATQLLKFKKKRVE